MGVGTLGTIRYSLLRVSRHAARPLELGLLVLRLMLVSPQSERHLLPIVEHLGNDHAVILDGVISLAEEYAQER